MMRHCPAGFGDEVGVVSPNRRGVGAMPLLPIGTGGNRWPDSESR